MNKWIVISALYLFLLLPFQAVISGNELYYWTDENGVTHYSDSRAKIPEEYKDNYKEMESRTRNPVQSKSRRGDSPEPAPESSAKTYRVPFRSFEGSSRRIIVNVTINDTLTVPFVLDTGSPGMIISTDLADRLGLLEKKKGVLLSRAGGIGGTAPAIRIIIDKVEIGGASDSFIPTTVIANMSKNFDGLIGMDFMAKYSMYIDHEDNSLVLKELTANEERPGGRSKDWWIRTFMEFKAYRNAWADRLEKLDDYERNTLYNTEMTQNSFRDYRELAEWQYDEASRLLRKLEKYARDNSVPTSWWR